MLGYIQHRGGEEKGAFKSKEGGRPWETNLRPDLRRIGMCHLETFLAVRILSNTVLSNGGWCSLNARRYVVTGTDSVAQECHLRGRFPPFF